MDGKELAQKILDMIEKAQEQASKLIETYAIDTIDALVDDIEELCRELVK
jgi:hypothetical protein